MRLQKRSVHVWVTHVDRLPGRSALSDSLSNSECEQAAKFRFERDRIGFLRRREFVRGVLARYTGIAPDRLWFGRNEYGKPYLDGPDNEERILSFSASHSVDLAVVCLAQSCPVGIDIESRSAASFDQDEMSYALTPEEVNAVNQRSRTMPDAFLRFWTCKEALLKAMGTGLSFPPDQIEISGIAGVRPRVRRIAGDHDAPGQWHLRRFVPEAGYSGAIAIRGWSFQPSVRIWDAEDHRRAC